VGDGLFSPAEADESGAEIAVGVVMVGIETDGAFVVGDGVEDSSLGDEGDAEVVVCVGIIGAKGEGALIAGDGLTDASGAVMGEGVFKECLNVVAGVRPSARVGIGGGRGNKSPTREAEGFCDVSREG